MITTTLAEQLVTDFWDRVGYEERFPRTLERAIMSATPVFVVKVHRQRLSTLYMRDWLRDRGIDLPMPWKERRVNGCLVAYRGEAAIFLDGTLAPEDARVVIAHEFGHYLAEYAWPRVRVLRRLGDSVLDVLDGDRSPEPNEGIAAALADVRLGAYVHYMDRGRGSTAMALVDQVERTADMVGGQLLAPDRAVFAALRMNGGMTEQTEAWTTALETQFGLPAGYAKWWASRLLGQVRRQKSFSEILGI